MAPTLLQINACKEHATSGKENAADIKEERFKKEEEEEEEEEDLFEIDLEAVGNLPPPYYWESYLTETTYTLFANCLVPVTDVLSAVPMANLKDVKQVCLGSGSGRVLWVRGAELLGDLSNLLQKTLDVSSSFNQGK